MSRKEARAECMDWLREIQVNLRDPEKDHADADRALVKFLNDIGESDIADLYSSMSDNFWYA